MTDHLAGFFAPWLVYGAILGLHLALPARRVEGYVRDEKSGALMRYRLNGPLVFTVSIGLWFAACYSGVLPWDWLWQHRWSGVTGACALSLAMTAAVVLSTPGRGRSVWADLYLGRRANPQMLRGRADAKMLLYLVGAIYLELNLLSFAAHHFLAYPDDPSPGVILYVALFTWFVCDYLVFERVHLYTYDFVAERLGFKLVWGCLTWYPYFYAVGLWCVADLPNPQTPAWLLALSAIVFFAGWTLARGSNMQKFAFKRDPEHVFLGRIPAKTFSDGEHSVLYSGFWGVSRHVNYLGEFLMACGLALSLGWPLVLGPWLYPLYYVALLVSRERDDDRRCAEKYGPLWEQYRQRVRWRIVPGIY
ncbi:MAG: DUF1295 domain-containing protein [Gammaproteobacteria bacterium]|nr:DUF1295 domain-containing protein [Gammaproteobacteria bacterium]